MASRYGYTLYSMAGGHAHYDHLMDVPYVARRHATRATILGNTTVKNTLAPFAADGLDTARVVDVSGSAANVEGGGDWIRVAPDPRVLPLESDHAPHFQGVTLYAGTRDRPMPVKPRSAQEWLEGETLAWLIDVLGPDDELRFRIYYAGRGRVRTLRPHAAHLRTGRRGPDRPGHLRRG